MSIHPDPLSFVMDRLASSIRPPEPMPFSQWLGENIMLVDGPQAGEPWSAAGAPYMPEIADCLSDDHPCNYVDVRKSQQTGVSILALAWCLYIADREPANTLYGAPGIDALRDLNAGKLQPLIEAWHKKIRRQVILPVTSRSGAGSTTYEKVFPGGRLWLGNANAVMDLSGKTAKKGVQDEFSKWEDIPGYGDPDTLFFGRFTAFRRIKSFKILRLSTPEVDTGGASGEESDGHCRIDRVFRTSDQRFWNCTCPECRRLFVFHFAQLRIDEQHPHRTAYECRCGHRLSEAERVIAVRGGRWVPSNEEGDHPGFHVDAFISLMMSLEAIAEDWLKAQRKGTETAKKDFSCLVLGLPYRFKGSAPEYRKLFERREDYKRGHVPAGALLITIGCDVQMRGIYYEVVAWAPDGQSWVIEAEYLEGATTDHDGGAFLALDEVYKRSWPDAYGNRLRPDEFAIDEGYNTNAVRTWVRGKPGVRSVKGLDGWGRPALGIATDQDIDYRGRKIKGGVKMRGVGTWPLKSTFYGYLSLVAAADGAALVHPPGYCHFGLFLDENYFKQITSETLADKVEKRTGRRTQEWHQTGPNHFLDCRVYNMALADAYLSTFTSDDWANRAKERGIPEDIRKPDLFGPRELQRPAVAEEAPPIGGGSDYFAALEQLNRSN